MIPQINFHLKNISTYILFLIIFYIYCYIKYLFILFLYNYMLAMYVLSSKKSIKKRILRCEIKEFNRSNKMFSYQGISWVLKRSIISRFQSNFDLVLPLNPFDSIKNKLNNEVNIESPLISLREQCLLRFHETGINFSGMITRCNLQKFSLTRELTVSSLSRLTTKIHARSKDT